MEWSGLQQLSFVPKGALIGMIIVVLLDVTGGYWRGRRYRICLFLSDLFLCAVAAVITFFGSLVFSDGYLHPVLLCGVVLGAIGGHYLLGRWLAWLFCKLHCLVKGGTRKVAVLMVFAARLCFCRRGQRGSLPK